VKEGPPRARRHVLSGLPFHAVRSKFQIPHENQNVVAPVIRFYKSVCLLVTGDRDDRAGVDCQERDRAHRFFENCWKWLADVVLHDRRNYKALLEIVQSCKATTPFVPSRRRGRPVITHPKPVAPADWSDYRGVLAGLEGIAGKKAVNSEAMTVKN
jgi:hypothetical protein